jgi:hypothetical protein
MAKIFDAHILTAALVVVVAGLLGQYAAHGISPIQWLSGLAAVCGAIGLAVIVRTWPAQSSVRAEG